MNPYQLRVSTCALSFALVVPALLTALAWASTYVVMIPLNSPIYLKLETLDVLGYLDIYFSSSGPAVASKLPASR
jgi:hypothetical protein